MFESVTNLLENYGWYIFGFTVVGFVMYYKYMKPSIQKYLEKKHEADVKKFDADSRDKYAEKMKLARERQYEKFVKETTEQRAKREERQRQKELEEEAKKLNQKGKKSSQPIKSVENDPIGDPDEFVARKITGKKVVIFSKRTCPYCMKAKQALSVYRIPPVHYEIIELDGFPAKTTERIQNILGELTGASTVPRVFIDGVCLGGGDETVKALGNGKLAQLLKEAGAI